MIIHKITKNSTICLAFISLNVSAANFSFTGSFIADNDVQLFNFSVSSLTDVTLRTYGYAGGIQANGNIVTEGGFDPILALFDGSGNLINQIDDDNTNAVNVDLNTNEARDALLTRLLDVGNYTLAVTQFSNFAGPTLADAFFQSDDPFFTASLTNPSCSNGQFCDTTRIDVFNNRTNAWALDILNVDSATSVVPVPAAVWLFVSGLIGLIGLMQKSSLGCKGGEV